MAGGATAAIHNPESGQVWEAAIFVAVLGSSNYTYAEASLSQGLADWIGAHMRAFEFLGGVPEIVSVRVTAVGVPLTNSPFTPVKNWRMR